jgi:hypothetical protein
MNSLSERPEALDQILDAADPRYAKLEVSATLLWGGYP